MSLRPADLDGHPVGYTDARDRGYYIAAGLGCRDGDTIVTVMDLGFRYYPVEALRLMDIDCPETRQGTAEERKAGREAKERTATLVTDVPLLVRTPGSRVSFDRFVAEVYVPGFAGDVARAFVLGPAWTRLGDILVAEGHAVRV